MVESLNQPPQSDQLHVIADAAGGCCWRICSGGVCVEDRSGARVMARFRDLLISQGRAVPFS